MNDLMTKSFLSYVDLKKQARLDMESELDLEKGQPLNLKDDENLSLFYQEAEAVKSDMEEINNLLSDLRSLNEEAKSTHSAKILRGLRDRTDSDVVSILRKLRTVKARLEGLDQSNAKSRKGLEACREGIPVDRTRVSITSRLRARLREIMASFQSLREKIVADHKEDLRRKYFCNTGELPSEDLVEKMVSGVVRVEMFEGKSEADLGNKARHETVVDLQKSLDKLHQVFLDMAVLVEAQGEKMDDIEENVASAGEYISGGTHSLYYANQMKKKTKWVYWVWIVVVIILLVCLISMLAS